MQAYLGIDNQTDFSSMAQSFLDGKTKDEAVNWLLSYTTGAMGMLERTAKNEQKFFTTEKWNRLAYNMSYFQAVYDEFFKKFSGTGATPEQLEKLNRVAANVSRMRSALDIIKQWDPATVDQRIFNEKAARIEELLKQGIEPITTQVPDDPKAQAKEESIFYIPIEPDVEAIRYRLTMENKLPPETAWQSNIAYDRDYPEYEDPIESTIPDTTPDPLPQPTIINIPASSTVQQPPTTTKNGTEQSTIPTGIALAAGIIALLALNR